MKTIIFARVSTNRQVNELTTLANSKGWSVEAVFAEKISGAKANAERTELLKEEMNAVIKRMDSVQDKYIDGDIDKETYNRMMERYSREAESIKERIALLETHNSANIEPKMGYAISLINNIDRFILDAPIAL